MEERELVRWQIEPLERRHRGVDERITIALPWLRRRMLTAITRLPAGSPVRRATLTRAVRTGWAATNRDDYDALRASLHPEIELVPPGRGEAGPREIADAGGTSFAVRLGMIGTLRDADTEVQDEYRSVITLKDGQVFRQENFFDWSTALSVLATPPAAGNPPP